MPRKVVIVQTEQKSARVLARLFAERGDRVWQTTDIPSAVSLVEQNQPDLIVLDLHLPGDPWLDFLNQMRQEHPAVKILITNRYPALQREMQAKERGARVFLREPFSRTWLEKSIESLYGVDQKTQPIKKPTTPVPATPHVRFPVRIKITLPYFLLALAFALAATYIVSQTVLETLEDRFNSQLASTGKSASDWMVKEETRLLETLRLAANSQGLAAAVQAGDAETVRSLIYPLAVNSQEEAVEILDLQGVSVLSLRHKPGAQVENYDFARGETAFAGWSFVQNVLKGQVENGQDKYAGLVQAAWGNYFYVAGPIKDDQGKLVGIILVGESLEQIVQKIRGSTLADISIYDLQGNRLASSVNSPEEVSYSLDPSQVTSIMGNQDQSSMIRELTVGSNKYSEILGPWEARGGEDLGVMGVSMLKLILVRTSQITRAQIFLIVAIAILLVIAVGISLADQITRPLLRVVSASSEVARGNLAVKLKAAGNDEVAVLAHSFNTMVAELQEGSIYRDLLGRTVSPEVREQLRQTFKTGDLRLEGQEAIATVLMTDIRGFTTLSERAGPTTILNWLNEYFGELVPIVTSHGGVVNKFDGDAMLAFFGILPTLLDPQDSAYAACKTAIHILKAIERLNIHRVERGEMPLATGIGVHTGEVTAGGLGSTDRLHYTIIGDTVNTTQRIETLTRTFFKTTGALVSGATVAALGDRLIEFNLKPLGLQQVKGKEESIMVYRLSVLNARDEEPL